MTQRKRYVKEHHSFAGALHKLGLYQVSRLGTIPVNPSLISALVDRWRPETHTFHMPTGEMTVTLQDVAVLWGLPISGKALTGESDREWGPVLNEVFGMPVPNEAFKKRTQRRGHLTVTKYSKYHLRLKWFKEEFSAEIPDNAPETLRRYRAAYIMELIGAVVLPDPSGDCMPAMYAQFLQNIEHQRERTYSWGSAVLALLYRNLCRAAYADAAFISGKIAHMFIFF